MGFSQFGDVAAGAGISGTQSGGSSREKENSGLEGAMALDEYAAAVREVAMPSPGLTRSKESMSYC